MDSVLPVPLAPAPAGQITVTFFRVIPKPGSLVSLNPYTYTKGAKAYALGFGPNDSFYFSAEYSLEEISTWGQDHDPMYMALYRHGIGFYGMICPEWLDRAPTLMDWCRKLEDRPYSWFDDRLVYLPTPYQYPEWLDKQFPTADIKLLRKRERWRVAYWRARDMNNEKRRIRDTIRDMASAQAIEESGNPLLTLAGRAITRQERAKKETEIVYEDDFIGPCTRARLKRYNWLRTMVLKQDPIPIPD